MFLRVWYEQIYDIVLKHLTMEKLGLLGYDLVMAVYAVIVSIKRTSLAIFRNTPKSLIHPHTQCHNLLTLHLCEAALHRHNHEDTVALSRPHSGRMQ